MTSSKIASFSILHRVTAVNSIKEWFDLLHLRARFFSQMNKFACLIPLDLFQLHQTILHHALSLNCWQLTWVTLVLFNILISVNSDPAHDDLKNEEPDLRVHPWLQYHNVYFFYHQVKLMAETFKDQHRFIHDFLFLNKIVPTRTNWFSRELFYFQIRCQESFQENYFI